MAEAIRNNRIKRDLFGKNPIILALQTAILAITEIGLKRESVIAILLYYNVVNNSKDIDALSDIFGNEVGCILRSLCRIRNLYKKSSYRE